MTTKCQRKKKLKLLSKSVTNASAKPGHPKPLAFYLQTDDIIVMLNAMGVMRKTWSVKEAVKDATACNHLELFFIYHVEETAEHVRSLRKMAKA